MCWGGKISHQALLKSSHEIARALWNVGTYIWELAYLQWQPIGILMLLVWIAVIIMLRQPHSLYSTGRFYNPKWMLEYTNLIHKSVSPQRVGINKHKLLEYSMHCFKWTFKVMQAKKTGDTSKQLIINGNFFKNQT